MIIADHNSDVTDEARFLKKKRLPPKFGPNRHKSGPK